MTDEATKEILDRFMALAESETGVPRARLLEVATESQHQTAPVPSRSPVDLMRARSVPQRHLDSMAEPTECPTLDAVKKFLANDRTILVLSGGEGTRKSGSASWALGRTSGAFVTAAKYLQLVVSKRDDEIEMLERIEGCDLIVLDDLGKEYHSQAGWAAARVGNLFQMRYDSKQKIIVTTMLGSEDFMWRYGTHVVGRIRESGTWVSAGQESVRGK